MKIFLPLSILVSSVLFSVSAQAQDSGHSNEFSTCMDASGGVTAGMIDCITAEYKQQDARLNKAYKSLMAGLNAERGKQLKAAQRAWIKFRDTNCEFYMDPDGGTLARVNANDCMMQMTAHRAQEIERLK